MITVIDGGQPHKYSFDGMEKYHGPLAPGGIAFAYKMMQLAFPVFSPDGPIQRLELKIETSFPGLGVRDAFEMVTRAVTRGCYRFDLAVGDAYEDRGYLRGFVFRLTYHGKTITLILRENIVRDEFLALVAKGTKRTKDEEMHFMWLKEEMGARVMKLHASAVFEMLEDRKG